MAVVFSFSLFVSRANAQSEEYKEAFSAYQTQNFDKAGEIWRKLADQGDTNALYALGVMELRGETENASEKQAFELFEQAATRGHSTAMFNVGVAFWQGSGADQDRAKALRWWEQSANAGDSGAQFNLGLAYYIGEERPTDLKLAAKWISRAAEQNHPEALRIYKIISEENPGIVDSLSEEDLVASTDSQGSSNNTISATPTAPEPSAVDEEIDSQSDTSNQESSEIEASPTGVEFWKTNAKSPLRVSPDDASAVFSSLPAGTPIEVVTVQGGWTMVTLPAGLKMWVFEDFLNVTGDNGVIEGTNVRVRPRPSTDNNVSPPVGVYRNGDRVTVLQKDGEWYGVRAPKHIGGWLPSDRIVNYIDSEENREELWQLMMANGF